jgi:hypothetical protein
MAVISDNDDDRKRKSSEEHGDGNKKRKTADVRPFHPDLEAAIEGLKADISKGQYILRETHSPLLNGDRIMGQRQISPFSQTTSRKSGSQSCGVG